MASPLSTTEPESLTTGSKPSSQNSMPNYKSIFDLLPNNEQYLSQDGSPDFAKLFDAIPFKALENNDQYATRIPNSKLKGFSSVYRNVLSPDSLVSTLHPDLNTGFKMFENACNLFGDDDAFGIRKFNQESNKFDDFFTYESFNQVKTRRNNLSSGIKILFPNDSDFIVSIYSPNRPEWLLIQYAAIAQSLPITSLYDTLGPKTTQYILNFTQSPILFCPTNKIMGIIKLASTTKLSNLKYIISMDPIDDFEKHFGMIAFAKSNGLTIMSIHQLESIGEMNPMPLNPPTPDSLFAISFTSGTTGNPKGVELTHETLVSALSSAMALIDKPWNIGSNEQSQGYSFLPLAHIYELLTANLSFSRGARLAFPNDPTNPSNLLENFKICKPHFVSLVPRVYSKFESALKQGLNSSYTGRFILNSLLGDSIPDWLRTKLQSRTRSVLGLDRTNFAVTGSAPINPATVEFLTKVLGIKFKLGYGLTESFAGTATSSLKDSNRSTCGGIFLSTEIKLADVPSMDYLTFDEATGKELDEPKGEIMLRGPQIFRGYYKNPEATNQVFNDGWFRTGDVGHIDKLGRLYVIDRVKNFFKLSQGEYVSPEKIENIYLSKCDFLSQIFVTGQSVESYLVGVVGIDPIAIKRVFKRFKSMDEYQIVSTINTSPKLKKELLHKMNSKIKELQGFEKIHNLQVSIEPLKISDDTITPTMKIKRNIANKFFKKEIEEMYSEGDLIRSVKI